MKNATKKGEATPEHDWSRLDTMTAKSAALRRGSAARFGHHALVVPMTAMVPMMPVVPVMAVVVAPRSEVEVDARTIVAAVVPVRRAVPVAAVPMAPVAHLLDLRAIARCGLEVSRKPAGGRGLRRYCEESQSKCDDRRTKPTRVSHFRRSPFFIWRHAHPHSRRASAGAWSEVYGPSVVNEPTRVPTLKFRRIEQCNVRERWSRGRSVSVTDGRATGKSRRPIEAGRPLKDRRRTRAI
jgi:hypothetical protein